MSATQTFYHRLGVSSGATLTEIKAAFRKLAKESHPDSGNVSDGGERFRRLTEAYETLSDPVRRAEYDASLAAPETSNTRANKAPDPVRCKRCQEITAQPRYVLYWRVWSVVFLSVKEPIQGIFCAKCASIESVRASVLTGLFGWWSVHGLINTPISLVGNAFGGKKFPDLEEKLLFQNLIAFLYRNELRISGGLASRLMNASDQAIRNAVSDIIPALRSQGASIAKLKDPWTFDGRGLAAGMLSLILPPLALFAWINHDISAHNNTSQYSGSPAEPALFPTGPAVSGSEGSVAPAAIETCKLPPATGFQLGGSFKKLKGSHVLEIDNGSSGDAIVKIRDAYNNALRYSFFVKKSEKATVKKIPDGTYIIQYAVGDALAADCKSLLNKRASRFPGVQEFVTRREMLGDYTRIGYSRLSYTLYSVPGGNVRPETLEAADFDS